MEKMNQAVMQILTSLIQALVPLIQSVATELAKTNPQAAAGAGAALSNLTSVLQNPGGGGPSGGVLAR